VPRPRRGSSASIAAIRVLNLACGRILATLVTVKRITLTRPASTDEFTTCAEERSAIAAMDVAYLSPFRFQGVDRQAADQFPRMDLRF
jgi:hypothetical protein